jgi:ABC-2 type transport system permease protein
MNYARVRAVIGKELLEIRKSRVLLFTLFLPPLLLAILPIVVMTAAGGQMAAQSGTNGGEIARFYGLSSAYSNFTPLELSQWILLQEFLMLYLIMPIVIPITVAAYSIIGEKQSRSLEPLLATPIRTDELLLGKSIAGIIPAALATWAAYLIFLFGTRLVVSSPRVLAAAIGPTWIFAMLILVPLLALLSMSIGVMISSRVNDTRAAQQIGGMLVLPIVALGIAQTAGLVLLNAITFIGGAALLALLDVVMLRAAARLFQRETILTRWK